MPKGVYFRTKEHNRNNGLAHKGKCKYWLGKKRSKETIRKIKISRIGKCKGIENPNWKGDNICYISLHGWVARNLGKPMECSKCSTTKAKMYHWANVSGEYKRSNGLNDWIRLCVSCHSFFDYSSHALGERNGNSRLTYKNVKKIIKEYSLKNTSHRKLAKKYNVSKPTIMRIVNKKTWKHII